MDPTFVLTKKTSYLILHSFAVVAICFSIFCRVGLTAIISLTTHGGAKNGI